MASATLGKGFQTPVKFMATAFLRPLDSVNHNLGDVCLMDFRHVNPVFCHPFDEGVKMATVKPDVR
ncbi:MAG: hypothetical protein IJU44_09275 [Kiritimatiellae bacterium]|nr:hypothetical protein [Kiritimatiellia bacterium]